MGRQRQQPQGPLLLHHPRRPQTARRRNQELVAHRRHDGPPSGERIMIALRVLLSRLLGRGRTHAELDSEIAAHLSLLAADYQRRGLSPADALAAARLWARAPPPADLASETAAPLSLLAADYQRRGLSPANALAAARLHFGPIAQLHETYRDQRRLPFFDALSQ